MGFCYRLGGISISFSLCLDNTIRISLALFVFVLQMSHAMRIVGQEASLVDALSIGSWASASCTESKSQSSTTLQSSKL